MLQNHKEEKYNDLTVQNKDLYPQKKSFLLTLQYVPWSLMPP